MAVLSVGLTFSVGLFCIGLGVILLFGLHEKDQSRWVSIEYKKEDVWILESAAEGIVPAKLLSSSVMMRYLLILHFEALRRKQKKIVVIFPDQLMFKAYRALRRGVKYSS
ncbi:MAG: hypothetical protein Q8L78_01720 [Coxiellaceae bacterium]|nr:hypothetical protein [Coxiellaceae bacterium]